MRACSVLRSSSREVNPHIIPESTHMRRVCAVYLITPQLLRLTLGNKKSTKQIGLGCFTVQLYARFYY